MSKPLADLSEDIEANIRPSFDGPEIEVLPYGGCCAAYLSAAQARALASKLTLLAAELDRLLELSRRRSRGKIRT